MNDEGSDGGRKGESHHQGEIFHCINMAIVSQTNRIMFHNKYIVQIS